MNVEKNTSDYPKSSDAISQSAQQSTQSEQSTLSGTSRKCTSCGRLLPADAAFCPYCETILTEKKEAEKIPFPDNTSALKKVHPAKRKQMFLTGMIAALVLVAAFLAARLYFRPEPVSYGDGGASVSYAYNGHNYRIYLSFLRNAGETGLSMPDASLVLEPGQQSLLYSMLFIQPEAAGDSGTAQEEEIPEDPAKDFRMAIASCEVSATARGSYLTMPVSEPESRDDIPGCMYIAGIQYGPDHGTNDLQWTITMKNGDHIVLGQTITCKPLYRAEVHWEETSLETIDQINAAVEDAYLADENTIVELYLPPVTYNDPWEIRNHAVIVHGTQDGEQITTFREPVTVYTRVPNLCEFNGVVFGASAAMPVSEEADPLSAGLCAYEGVVAKDCSFNGCQVGADARDGSWIILEDCTFSGNQVGFRFNSGHATCSAQDYQGLVFQNNGIGMQIQKVPADLPLILSDCSFSGNGEDIQDPQGYVTG